MSGCDRAGECRYDRQCPFYAEHCRHDGQALACERPADCPNGPQPHEFVPDNPHVMPCFKQSWEDDNGQLA